MRLRMGSTWQRKGVMHWRRNTTRLSSMVASQIFGDHTIGDAILDRPIHCAQRLELKGPSMRKRHNPEVSAAVSTGLDERLGEARRNQPSAVLARRRGRTLSGPFRRRRRVRGRSWADGCVHPAMLRAHLRVLGGSWKPPAQVDNGGQLSLFIEDSTDPDGIGFSDDEHPQATVLPTADRTAAWPRACVDGQHDELLTSSTRPNQSFVYRLRTASPARGASFAPHFGQRSGWHARQKVRRQAAHGASAAGTTRCSASSHTRRGRSLEAVNSHAGGSSARANGFQSSKSTRSALRRRICTVKR